MRRFQTSNVLQAVLASAGFGAVGAELLMAVRYGGDAAAGSDILTQRALQLVALSLTLT